MCFDIFIVIIKKREPFELHEAQIHVLSFAILFTSLQTSFLPHDPGSFLFLFLFLSFHTRACPSLLSTWPSGPC